MSLPGINFLHFMVSEISPGQDIYVMVTTARSNQSQTMMLHTYNSQPISLPRTTSYTLQFLRYSLDKIRSRSIRQGQRSNQGHTMTLHTYTPNQYLYQVSTSYTLRFPRYSPDKILWVKVTTARLKVKSRSHHDVAHLHPQPISVPSINFLHLTVSEI